MGVHHPLGPRRGAGRVQHGGDFLGRNVGQCGSGRLHLRERRKRGIQTLQVRTVGPRLDSKRREFRLAETKFRPRVAEDIGDLGSLQPVVHGNGDQPGFEAGEVEIHSLDRVLPVDGDSIAGFESLTEEPARERVG